MATVPPHLLAQLSKLPPPQTVADIAALTAVAIASAAYLSHGIIWDKPDPFHHVWFERPQLREGGVPSKPQATRNIAQKMKEAVSDYIRSLPS